MPKENSKKRKSEYIRMLKAEVAALRKQSEALRIENHAMSIGARCEPVVDMIQPIEGAIIIRGWSDPPPSSALLRTPGRITLLGHLVKFLRPELLSKLGPEAEHWGYSAFFLLNDPLSTEEFRETTVEITQLGETHRMSIVEAAKERLENDARSWDVFPRFLNSLTASSRVIEIGSRARLGTTMRHLLKGEYVGIDIKAGPNVDVIGDAHFLRDFVNHKSFTHAVSASVFEHLACPIQVVSELNGVLEDGALVYNSTHQSWPIHEHPWDYFRFSDSAWHAIFNQVTGFEVIEARLGDELSLVPVSERGNPALNRLANHNGGYATSVVLARKTGPSGLERLFTPETIATIYEGNYPY